MVNPIAYPSLLTGIIVFNAAISLLLKSMNFYILFCKKADKNCEAHDYFFIKKPVIVTVVYLHFSTEQFVSVVECSG